MGEVVGDRLHQEALRKDMSAHLPPSGSWVPAGGDVDPSLLLLDDKVTHWAGLPLVLDPNRDCPHPSQPEAGCHVESCGKCA